MKSIFFSMFLILLLGPGAVAQDTFQLAPPILRFSSAYFKLHARVEMVFAQNGTQIHFTTDGRTPTEKDPVYTRPVLLRKQRTCLKARTFGAGFLPSEVVEANFFKRGLPIESLSVSQAHVQYPGESGAKTLNDGKGGIVQHNSISWMGFQRDSVLLSLTLQEKHTPKQLLLHVLQNQPAWIFLPVKVEVHGKGEPEGMWMVMGSKTFNSSEKNDLKACVPLVIDLDKPLKTDLIMIKIYTLAQLPAWHSGKGLPAWFFLDEINIY